METVIKQYRSSQLGFFIILFSMFIVMVFVQAEGQVKWYLTAAYLIISLVISGITCKEVLETEESYKVIYMWGLLSKEFKKDELYSNFNEGSLTIPDPVITVDNTHIKFRDSQKVSIIYPIGTKKFETLKIRLEKQRREQESEADFKPPSSDFNQLT